MKIKCHTSHTLNKAGEKMTTLQTILLAGGNLTTLEIVAGLLFSGVILPITLSKMGL